MVAKYDALERWLIAQPGPTIRVEFHELDQVVGGLPPSARNHPAWWANDVDGRHVQAKGWLNAGWIVDEVNQDAGWVVFKVNS